LTGIDGCEGSGVFFTDIDVTSDVNVDTFEELGVVVVVITGEYVPV
jgi:hypothetical protein